MEKNEMGQKIRELRKSLDLTQEELAGRAHIDRTTLQRIENAEISTSVDTLYAIGIALNKRLIIDFCAPKSSEPEIVYNVSELFASIDRRLAAIEAREPIGPQLNDLEVERRTKAAIDQFKKKYEEIIAAWNDATEEPEQQVIGLIALTGESKYLQRLSPENQKIWGNFLKAGGARLKRGAKPKKIVRPK